MGVALPTNEWRSINMANQSEPNGEKMKQREDKPTQPESDKMKAFDKDRLLVMTQL
jgi:hypothetical protein